MKWQNSIGSNINPKVIKFLIWASTKGIFQYPKTHVMEAGVGEGAEDRESGHPP